MVSAGQLGYQCSTQRNGLCATPQVLGERGALVALRTILADLLPTAEVLAAENARQASSNDRVGELESKLAVLEQQQQEDTDQWMSIRGVKPLAITRALQERQTVIEAVQTQLIEAREELTASKETFAGAQELIEHSAEIMDHLTPYQQARVYRILVTEVRIRGVGISKARRWHVESYTKLLNADTVSSTTASSLLAKLSLAMAS
jgi:tRNA G10  N-methylase Trm11